MPNNQLTLAVAGSRKTQGIVEACASAATNDRILILTYTTANQLELRARLARYAGKHVNIEVMGWFSFLIGHIVRPYVPFKFPERRVEGFDFESPPRRGTTVHSDVRYFDSRNRVCKVHLPQLALLVEQSCSGLGIKRLSRLYDRIFIDEVQDLSGYDLEILRLLMESEIPLDMVGDVRQAVLSTNERERKNRQFMFMKIWNWFLAEERRGRLVITQRNETWRCRPEIAQFADSLFESSWGFEPTKSRNDRTTDHDGLFLVHSSDVPAYVTKFKPLFLRHSKNSGRTLNYNFMNFKISKGLTRERVLVYPTKDISHYIRSGAPLSEQQAAELYVAVTRAEQSVAFVLDDGGNSPLPVWGLGCKKSARQTYQAQLFE